MANNVIYDILDSVHTIIAGVTGSGKSVLLNDVIYTIIKNYSADDCKLILCDPKRLEFAKYKKLPHVLHYGNDTYSIISALRKAHDLMEKRYRTAEDDPWNDTEFTPVYIIIDELADLFLNGGKEVKTLMQSIAQKGRSANIHMIVATQHPSRQQFPSFIQDNFNTKIALRCDTPVQSKQIIGISGADALTVGNAIVRVEGKRVYHVHIPFIEMPEIRKVVELIIEERKERLNALVQSSVPSPERSAPAQQTTQQKPKSPVCAVLGVLKYFVLIPFCVVGKLLGKC